MRRPILIHPDPRLKKIAEPVADISDEIRALADDMLETMYHAPGIGLAAPQIGVMSRLFVMDTAKDEEEPRPLVMVNPEILEASDETSEYEEGCLSIPDQFGLVTRPAEIKMGYLDLDGNPQEIELSELDSTCAQHELDHLNGKLFIDYLSPIKRSMITKKMIKLKKEKARA
ncbi:peptide deformylase [Paracoccaceae bacterium GXU_MW_L88]